MTMNRTWDLDAAQIDAGDGRHSLYVAMNAATREVVTAVGDNKAHPEDAITDLLFEILRHHDEPELVITDSTPAFTSPGVAALFAKFGIRHEVRQPFSERRGAVERALRRCEVSAGFCLSATVPAGLISGLRTIIEGAIREGASFRQVAARVERAGRDRPAYRRAP